MDDIDKLVLNEVQYNFPLTSRPYRKIGENIGISESHVMRRLRRLSKAGVIRYIGAVFNSERIGFESTLVAAYVPKEKLKKVVRIINAFPEVTHNYLRKDYEFNLWFTVTTPKGKLSSFLRRIKRLTGIKKMIDLEKRKTFKIDTRFLLIDGK